MSAKEPVWLTAEDIERKYYSLFEAKKMTREFIGQLLRANLLRGYYNTHERKNYILEESWLNLLVHINYNLYLQMQPVNGEPITFSVPAYCQPPLDIKYFMDRSWYTPTEILDENPRLKFEHIFTEAFIVQLIRAGLLRGKMDLHEKCALVLLPSFIELLLYRNFTLKQNMYSP